MEVVLKLVVFAPNQLKKKNTIFRLDRRERILEAVVEGKIEMAEVYRKVRVRVW